MDKITHQVRAEHWTRILNECMNSGMSKTAWCRANGISEKQFFYWQRILRREAYEASQNPSLLAVTGTGQLSAVQQSVSFAEIKLPAVSPDVSSVFHPDLVIRKGKLVLEISNSASAELLSRIGGVLWREVLPEALQLITHNITSGGRISVLKRNCRGPVRTPCTMVK